MRYFRITLNPQDPYALAGPGGNSVLLRVPFYLSSTMFYAVLRDGGYVRVPDAEMGVVGPAIDALFVGDVGAPYPLFQTSVLPNGAQEADIPLWSAQTVPLAQPPAPMPQPTVWPVLAVVTPPETPP